MFLIFFNIEFFLSFCILNFLILIIFIKSWKKNKYDFVFDLFFICKNYIIFVLLLSMIILSYNFFIVYFFYSHNFFVTSFINFLKIVVLFILFIMLLSLNSYKIEKIKLFFPYGIYEFFILVLFNIVGLFWFLSSENFLLMYLGIELHSLTLSVLFSLRYFSKYSAESALKYFIVSSFSSSLFLFGVSFLYGVYGVINLESFIFFNVLEEGNSSLFSIYDFFKASDTIGNAVIVSISLILISILIKLGSAPFHMWTLDVYEGAPTFITMYALVIPKLIYVGFIIKMFFYFQHIGPVFFDLFKYCGIFSVLIGTVGALVQTKIKRILSYSAIANFGYILISLGTGHMDGIIASLLFLITYIIVTCNIFIILLSLVTVNDNNELKSIFQLSTLTSSGKSLEAFLLCLCFFTLSSIPPSNIFISKYILLYSILENTSFFFNYVLVFIVVLSNIFSCFYYIRIIRLIFFNTINEKILSVIYIVKNFFFSYIVALLSIFNVFLFFYPQIFLDFFDFLLLYDCSVFVFLKSIFI